MNNENQRAAAEAFSKQSSGFDSSEEKNKILQWMRARVHRHCMKFYKPGEKILELNCGTGIDAVFFAQHGLHIHATDIANGMLEELRRKVREKNLGDRISVQECSYTELELLEKKKFNHIFSNFGGLNCEKDIQHVIAQFKNLLEPGGTVTLVVMPPVCPWEIMMLLKGKFRTAFRRFRKDGTNSNVEGIYFKSYYFSPAVLIRHFGDSYHLKALEGLASFVPPPHHEIFPDKFPHLFDALCRLDEKFSHHFPFNQCADQIILTMQWNVL
jgi:ubiquinone/menaquinone biosynthesis C-methylase UbiE